MSSVDKYGVPKEYQEEIKIQKEIETVEVEGVRGERRFTEEVNSKCVGNEGWFVFKRKFLDVASEVCGYTKGKPRYFETWWWNKGVDVVECRKRVL